MKKTYTDVNFYMNSYLCGMTSKIPEKEFNYWFMLASVQIRRSTFDRIDDLETVPEEVQMCCCEIAEKLYAAEVAKDENGRLLQSYGNDGETGTFKIDELTEDGINKSVHQIIRKWLVNTGLMYCGVD